MSKHLESLDSLVHPHQMEIQEFSFYVLVIDARSTEAYQDDHLPGAVSVPVTTSIAMPPASSTAALVARDTEPAVPYALAAHLRRLEAGDTVLVYCDRGGLDSLVWAQPLKALGYRVDVLGGGWINYRRWVDAGLDVLPRALTFVHLGAPPAGGLCRVVDSLMALGEQVIDLTFLAGQKLLPGLTLAGDEPPTQAAFESALLDALRRFNPQRPVWVRDSLNGLGDLTLPPSFRDALLRSKSLRLEVPLAAQAQAWCERVQATGIDMPTLLRAVCALPPQPVAATIERWHSLASVGQVVDALTEVIQVCLDRYRQASHWREQAQVVELSTLTAGAVTDEVQRWRRAWVRGMSGQGSNA